MKGVCTSHRSAPALPRRVLLGAILAAVLVPCLLLTWLAWSVADRYRDQQVYARFHAVVDETRDRILQRMYVYEDMLLGAKGLVMATRGPTAAQWMAFGQELGLSERFPGVQGVGFCARVRLGDRRAFEASRRREGLASFVLRPASSQDAYPVTYLYPLDWRNLRALGFDMGSDPVRAEAIARARDTGKPALSAKVTLVQETDIGRQPGFLLYAPVYRGNSVPAKLEDRRRELVGFVYCPFRSEDLFRTVLANHGEAQIEFQLYDGPIRSPAHLLFEHHPQWARGHRSRFTHQETIQVAGEPWTLYFASPPGFLTHDRTPTIVLLSGLLVSGLLTAIAGILATGRERAEREVERRIAELRAANAQLAQLDRMKDEFLSIVSHELRTPINAIMGFGSILQDEIAGPLNETQQAYLGKLLGGTDMLLTLVNDLLDMSRIAAGKLHLMPQALAPGPLLRETVAHFSSLAEPKQIRVSYEEASSLPEVWVDPQRTVQVLSNLLNNALKFTPAGGHVTVAARAEDEAVRVSVTDTGIGIAPEDHPRLFQRFGQLDSSNTRVAGGTGLGLSISKSLVEAQGGQIGASSEGCGRGSTFWFTVPVAREV